MLTQLGKKDLSASLITSAQELQGPELALPGLLRVEGGAWPQAGSQGKVCRGQDGMEQGCQAPGTHPGQGISQPGCLSKEQRPSCPEVKTASSLLLVTP